MSPGCSDCVGIIDKEAGSVSSETKKLWQPGLFLAEKTCLRRRSAKGGLRPGNVSFSFVKAQPLAMNSE
jgi:hypothetical protein